MATIEPKNTGFKVRLRRPNTSQSTTKTTTMMVTSNIVPTKKVNNDNKCQPTTNSDQQSSSSMLSSTLSDPILNNIAHQLNIPEYILKTPTKNFGIKTNSNLENAAQKQNVNGINYNNYIDNNISYKFELESTIDSTFGNESTCHQGYTNTNTNLTARSFEMERLEARRRLELIQQKAELFNKFAKIKIEPTAEEEEEEDHEESVKDDNSVNYDNDDGGGDESEPANNKNKVIRAFSADDSVVEVTKDKFEPKYVRDINFEILKHPCSQQKISTKMDLKQESALKKSKTSSSSSSSSSRKKIKLKSKPGFQKYPPKLLPLNLETKLASVVDDSAAENGEKLRSHSNGFQKLSQQHSKSSNSICNDVRENEERKSSEKIQKSATLTKESFTKSMPHLNENSCDTVNNPNSSKVFEKIQKMADDLISKQVNKQSTHKSGQKQHHGADLKIKKIYVNQKPYQVLNNIGKGGSSKVYQVYCPETQRTLALKVVDLKNADKSILDGFRSEIKVLQKLSACQRVVKMYDYEFRNNNKELLIVMEKGDADLSNVLKSHFKSNQNQHLSPHLIKLYWQEMLEAVQEIHSNNIVHSDLKLVNFIMVSGKLKLIDFGIANTIQSDQTSVFKDTIIGTVDYMAPESFQKRSEHNNRVKFNQKMDIWSLGIILYNLVYGVTPFAHLGSDVMKKGFAIVNGDIKYGPISDPLLLDVIKQCLQKNPRKRPTATELLNHVYLRESSSDSDKNEASSQISKKILSQINNLTPDSLQKFSEELEKFTKK